MLKGLAAGVQAGIGGSVNVGGYTDNSATPGNTTINTPSGRASFAAANTCVVTCAVCTANSKVGVQLETQDTTLTSIITVVPAAGSFTVTGNAAATTSGAAKFRFVVFN